MFRFVIDYSNLSIINRNTVCTRGMRFLTYADSDIPGFLY